MPFDERLAERVRALFAGRNDVREQKMFGGVGFLLRGNMCVGVWKEFLILRVGEERSKAALAQQHTRPFDITGKAMRGWVMVTKEGCKSARGLSAWVQHAVSFVETLEPK